MTHNPIKNNDENTSEIDEFSLEFETELLDKYNYYVKHGKKSHLRDQKMQNVFIGL